MPRYWIIAPYDSTQREIWEKVWEYDLTKNVIAIGWKDLKDISSYDRVSLRKAIEEAYPSKNIGWQTWSFNSMWNFWHNISVGDIVIARKGTKKIAAAGTVTKTAFYDEAMGYERVSNLTDDFYSNFIGVQWSPDNRDIQFEKPIFSFQTIYEITEGKYKSLIKGEIPPEEEEIVEKNEFVMEKYLEEFIVSNFDQIFKGQLQLYRDAEGNVAQQYPTEIGRIDIIAEELTTNTLVVIELKKGRESDKVVGQTLRYMGWINENLKNESQKVRGIIICREPDPRLLFALKMVSNIELKYYTIDFKLVDQQERQASATNNAYPATGSSAPSPKPAC